jgi:glycine/D-amino acid oxidase-like deaminating enzyme
MTVSPAEQVRALSDARPVPFWTDDRGGPAPCEPLSGPTTADLVIIGGGLTGLWAAIEAMQRDPSADVIVLEAQYVGFGASGRNGGFISESLSHGIAHGAATWPGEMQQLLDLGRRNLGEIADFVETEGIDADLRLVGKSLVAVTPLQTRAIEAAYDQHREYGEDVTLLDADEARADVASPTYLGAMRVRSGGGLVDPARLCWGLRRSALRLGVRVHETSPVVGLERDGTGVRVVTDRGSVRARKVLVATNASPPPLRRLRNWVLPVYDHVLVTEPLSAAQVASLGWAEGQGITDAGNQFHYYRRTPDDRILFGGYDAIYHRGGTVTAEHEQNDASHRLLVSHFFETFPQLAGLAFTHRWSGAIDSTSRFTPLFGTAWGGRVSYSLGYTGLGVGASRFGAQVALDLLDGSPTERTELALVRRRPVPFPPEPLRYPLVRATQAALAREDATGDRGTWLRLLDRFGVGFNS